MLLVLVYLIYLGISFFDPSPRVSGILGLVFAIPSVFGQYLLSSQRIRDMGLTGWLALLWIPVTLLPEDVRGPVGIAFIIVLLVVPSKRRTIEGLESD